MSPLGLAITFELLKRGRNMDIKACFDMEYKLAVELLGQRELYEGIRALLIDKDRKPNWTYKTVQEVKDVSKYFLREESNEWDLLKS